MNNFYLFLKRKIVAQKSIEGRKEKEKYGNVKHLKLYGRSGS